MVESVLVYFGCRKCEWEHLFETGGGGGGGGGIRRNEEIFANGSDPFIQFLFLDAKWAWIV